MAIWHLPSSRTFSAESSSMRSLRPPAVRASSCSSSHRFCFIAIVLCVLSLWSCPLFVCCCSSDRHWSFCVTTSDARRWRSWWCALRVSWRLRRSAISAKSSDSSTTDSRYRSYTRFCSRSTFMRSFFSVHSSTCFVSSSISFSFWSRSRTSSAAFFSARAVFESFSCKNLLKRISCCCSSRSCFRNASSRRLNNSSRLANSSF
mmetsp:Transcript_11359/g.23416  ORF Transcript_11359/g.23416 Transcript_11359/m.23416 type:complete len:204 (-) Transcript_11359:196-807(-)